MKWQDGHWSRGTGVPGMYLRLGGSGGAIVDIIMESGAIDVQNLLEKWGTLQCMSSITSLLMQNIRQFSTAQQ